MKKIVVFGSYVTDLCIRTGQFPKPGETVKGHSFSMGPGGKGSNQAVAAHRAGADVTLITKLGKDSFGDLALAFYRGEGMNTDGILLDEKEETGCAFIMLQDETAQNQIIVNSGACGCITPEETEKAVEALRGAGILLTQLETNPEPAIRLLKCAKEQGLLTILNPAPAAPIPEDSYRTVDIITPNETEAELLTGIHVTDEASAEKAARVFFERGVKNVIITLGGMGAYANDGTEGKLVPAQKPAPVADTTGAGDCFSGALAAALAQGMDFFSAVKYGVCASGIAVTRKGTAPAMPRREEIEALYNAE